jgi:hypothetical protein
MPVPTSPPSSNRTNGDGNGNHMHHPHATRPKIRLLTSSSSLDDSYDEDHDLGLLVTITREGICQLEFCLDANWKELHPNVYAPASLLNMQALGGGGSGVAVFSGDHPQIGRLVMKHGGYKDMADLLALKTIAQELEIRGQEMQADQAAQDMQRRIPEFKMLYLSPHHFRSHGAELWGRLKHLIKSWSLFNLASLDKDADNHSSTALPPSKVRNFEDDDDCHLFGKSIRLYEGYDETLTFQLDANFESVAIVFPKDSCDFTSAKTVQLQGDAYTNLKSIVNELLPVMTENVFKFTLGQKTIGGEHPKTGNQLLYAGELHGKLLDNLINQFIQVIHNLQALTLPEEVDALELIRKEVEMFEDDACNLSADSVSPTADAFVGNVILKNFHPVKGRSRLLRELGAKFRTPGSFMTLTPEEEIPAHHLGRLLRSGALMSDSFCNCPMEPTVLHPHQHYWRNILRRAVDTRQNMSPTALRRIWTCGLTDAGIHNLFLSDNDLSLFDLGEPQLQSLPGFLTKFLFSFFHTLGMQEDENKDWIRRFEPTKDGQLLALTKETVDLLPKAYDAFGICLDRMIEELFEGDDSLRWLLLQYVTMQLLSDTAFCLQRWEIKGGGRARSTNHNKGIEKWLWRALWDVYVAYDINTQESWTRMRVEHPLQSSSG